MTAVAAAPRRAFASRRACAGLLGAALVLLCGARGARPDGAYVLASPTEVVRTILDNQGCLVRALGVTLANAAAGFVLGNLAAIASPAWRSPGRAARRS
jgi:sulfonate transport system permease protein